MSKRIKFVLDGCDISFTAEAPADMTLAQLLKQADRIKPDWCACGIRSMTPDDYDKTEIIFDYDDVRKADDDVSCRIKKIYLYHVTKPENVQSILQTGLRRDGGGRQTIAIYLSENPLSWYQPGLVILKVLIEGLTGDMTTFLPEQDEILYWGDIEPGRVSWAGCLTCRKNNNCGTKVAYDLFESLDPNSRRPICRDYESSEKEALEKDHGE